MEATKQVMLRLSSKTYEEVTAIAAAEKRSFTQVASRAVDAYVQITGGASQRELLAWARKVFAMGQPAYMVGWYISAWRRHGRVWHHESPAVTMPRPVEIPPVFCSRTLVTSWAAFADLCGADPTLDVAGFAAMWCFSGGLLLSACSPDAPRDDAGVVTIAAFSFPPTLWAPAKS
jgi:hypothetical protein